MGDEVAVEALVGGTSHDDDVLHAACRPGNRARLAGALPVAQGTIDSIAVPPRFAPCMDAKWRPGQRFIAPTT